MMDALRSSLQADARATRAALAALSIALLGACAKPPSVTGGCFGAPRPLASSSRDDRAAANPAEFIATASHLWIAYRDRAGASPQEREQSSERDFASLNATGSKRMGVPRVITRSGAVLPVDVVLGDTVLQLECEGACGRLRVSLRAPDNRNTVVRVDTRMAFPLLRIRNPTMYPQTLELQVDAGGAAAARFALKVTQWRFYLWSD